MSARPITTLKAKTMEINMNTIAAIVRNVSRLKVVPVHSTFAELNLTIDQMNRIQTMFVSNFGRTVSTIKHGDSIATLFDKLNNVKP